MSKVDERYLIKVKDYMNYPRPKLKSRFVVNYGEILPIILIDSEV